MGRSKQDSPGVWRSRYFQKEEELRVALTEAAHVHRTVEVETSRRANQLHCLKVQVQQLHASSQAEVDEIQALVAACISAVSPYQVSAEPHQLSTKSDHRVPVQDLVVTAQDSKAEGLQDNQPEAGVQYRFAAVQTAFATDEVASTFGVSSGELSEQQAAHRLVHINAVLTRRLGEQEAALKQAGEKLHRCNLQLKAAVQSEGNLQRLCSAAFAEIEESAQSSRGLQEKTQGTLLICKKAKPRECAN